jgi:hypothetical protein
MDGSNVMMKALIISVRCAVQQESSMCYIVMVYYDIRDVIFYKLFRVTRGVMC